MTTTLDDTVQGSDPRPNESGQNSSDRAIVELPGGEQSISAAAATIGSLLAALRTHFLRGGVVTRVAADGSMSAVKPAEFASDIESVVQLVRTKHTPRGPVQEKQTCSKNTADLILSAQSFRAALPPLNVVSACPVLVERDGRLVAIHGYDIASGIMARGRQPIDMTAEHARILLHDLVAEFRFATDSDRSRALAAMITPSLVLGGLLPGRAPIDLGEADASQTGKGYRNKVTAAVYGQTVAAIAQANGGVGSLENSFDKMLVAGRTFISFDNIRGRIDSPKLESFCTEDVYCARPTYCPETMIDPRLVVLMFTSNRADITPDLANRSSCVRILKQRADYRFRKFPEGDLLDHVRVNQCLYLGAVFAILRAWHVTGKPRTDESRHDFKAWAQTLDWIVTKLLKASPLLDGHREAQKRMTTPDRNWLRDVALAIVSAGREGEWLSASDILELLGRDEFADDAARTAALQSIGRRLGRAFKNTEVATLDHLQVSRSTTEDDKGKARHKYMVLPTTGGMGIESLPERSDQWAAEHSSC